jgi:hypothetical protein
MDPRRKVFRGRSESDCTMSVSDAVSTVAELAPAEESSGGEKAWLASNPMFCSSLRSN